MTGINECDVRNTSDWVACLEDIRQHGSDYGYVMKQANVVKMIATPNFIKQYGDEIQCCEGFSNQTFASHLCFNYYFDYVTGRPLNEESYQKSAPAPTNTTAATKIQESFGLFGRNISIGGGEVRLVNTLYHSKSCLFRLLAISEARIQLLSQAELPPSK